MIVRSLTWKANVHGQSRPWRVLALDALDAGRLPREFIVKHFRSDQVVARAVEYLAGRFAFDTDIQAVEPHFVVFTAAFLDDIRTLPEPPRDVHLAEPGTHVGFEWNPRAVCLMENHRALQSLDEPDQIGEIVGVDTVLVNIDRSDHNILFEPIADYLGHPMHRLLPIDWEHCFAGGQIDPAMLRNRKLLEIERPWTDLGRTPHDPMCGYVRSTSDFVTAVRKLGGWRGAKARLRLLVQGIPQEWGLSREAQSAVVDFLLARLDTTIRRLQRPDDPESAFPNWQNSLGLDSIA